VAGRRRLERHVRTAPGAQQVAAAPRPRRDPLGVVVADGGSEGTTVGQRGAAARAHGAAVAVGRAKGASSLWSAANASGTIS
jgi:hypothetical protein